MFANATHGEKDRHKQSESDIQIAFPYAAKVAELHSVISLPICKIILLVVYAKPTTLTKYVDV